MAEEGVDVEIWMERWSLLRIFFVAFEKMDTLPETTSKFTPENRPFEKERIVFLKHPFSGEKLTVSGRVWYQTLVNDLNSCLKCSRRLVGL